MFNSTDIGFIVTDNTGLGFAALSFNEAAKDSESDKKVHYIDVSWHNKPKWSKKDSHGFNCISYPCLNNSVYLLSVPMTYRTEFLLQDLEFPLHIAGIICMVNMVEEIYWPDKSPRIVSGGGFYWIKGSTLPVVMVTIGEEKGCVTRQEMLDVIKLANPFVIIPDRNRYSDNIYRIPESMKELVAETITALIDLVDQQK